MPVVGPLAMRANVWEASVDTPQQFRDWDVHSPQRSSFTWESPVQWAQCVFCPKDEHGHVMVGADPACHCGIYATLRTSTVRGYMGKENSVPYLVEALGHYLLGTEGFRAAGVQLTAVLDLDGVMRSSVRTVIKTSKSSIALQAASEFFKIPIIPYEIAKEMMKIHWEKEGLYWPF